MSGVLKRYASCARKGMADKEALEAFRSLADVFPSAFLRWKDNGKDSFTYIACRPDGSGWSREAIFSATL
jgi:hypothetical protein